MTKACSPGTVCRLNKPEWRDHRYRIYWPGQQIGFYAFLRLPTMGAEANTNNHSSWCERISKRLRRFSGRTSPRHKDSCSQWEHKREEQANVWVSVDCCCHLQSCSTELHKNDCRLLSTLTVHAQTNPNPILITDDRNWIEWHLESELRRRDGKWTMKSDHGNGVLHTDFVDAVPKALASADCNPSWFDVQRNEMNT